MSLLYTNLESIYNNNNYYQRYHPLEPLKVMLRDYLTQNVKLGNLTIDPMDFAFRYHLNAQMSLDLFLILSEYGLLIKEYFLTCDECGEPSIELELDNFTICMNCNCRLLNLNITNKIDIFNNIKYVFEINEELLLEIRKDIKVLPSSSFKIPEEEDRTTQLNVKTILENLTPSLEGIKHERDYLQEKLIEGMLDI